MKEIALRYGDERLTSLAFDENAPNQELFETVKCTDLIYNKTEDSGIMLNGRRYAHLLYCHKEIEIVISANEINSNILAFLQNFWVAKYKYIAIRGISSWSNYAEVMTETGRFPITYLEELRELPEVQFNLIFAKPI